MRIPEYLPEAPSEADIRKDLPRFSAGSVVGTNIDEFHKNPAHQRGMMAQPRKEPHFAEITVGDLRFSLKITSVIDAAGEYVGNVLEWDNVTQDRLREGMLEAINKVLKAGTIDELRKYARTFSHVRHGSMPDSGEDERDF